MVAPAADYSLYYVTGREQTPSGIDFYVSLEEACKGGVTIVQLREKKLTTKEYLTIGRKCKDICDKYSVPLIINDRVDVALALRCGLHVGQDDMPASMARSLIGPDQLLGVSINTEAEMLEALKEGVVDYVGIGPAYTTQSKTNLSPVLGTRGVSRVLGVLGKSDIKAVVIGGVSETTIPNVLLQCAAPLDEGYRSLDGLAVVSAIAGSLEPQAVARRILALFRAGRSSPLPLDAVALSPDSNAARALEVVEMACALLVKLRAGPNPLVHHITNQVVMNDTANLTLALGGSPMMTSLTAEVAELSSRIGALVLNFGTLGVSQVEAQMTAGLAAKKNGKPIVFDPVAVGATEYRKTNSAHLLSSIHMNIIKGNAAEIGALTGSSEVQTRGVDSVGSGFNDPKNVVQALARREKLTIAMSGVTDYISDGQTTFAIDNGSHFQGVITGSGCMATSSIAVFAAVSDPKDPHAYVIAAVAGLLAINVAAEVAAARSDVKGPNSFRMALIDEAYNLTPEVLREKAKLRVI
ncbi:thiamine-phosphate diphosphorylase / hydroxyethylthiazole kinase, partial [Phenoliferia sp. Uapishka_3]